MLMTRPMVHRAQTFHAVAGRAEPNRAADEGSPLVPESLLEQHPHSTHRRWPDWEGRGTRKVAGSITTKLQQHPSPSCSATGSCGRLDALASTISCTLLPAATLACRARFTRKTAGDNQRCRRMWERRITMQPIGPMAVGFVEHRAAHPTFDASLAWNAYAPRVLCCVLLILLTQQPVNTAVQPR